MREGLREEEEEEEEEEVFVTTAEASAMVNVAPATVRWWVARGYLAPVRHGAKPLQFRESDVWRCARDRMSAMEAERLDALWDKIARGY